MIFEISNVCHLFWASLSLCSFIFPSMEWCYANQKKKTKTAVLCCITAANNQILQINIFFFIRWFQMLVSGTNVWQLSLQIQYY